MSQQVCPPCVHLPTSGARMRWTMRPCWLMFHFWASSLSVSCCPHFMNYLVAFKICRQYFICRKLYKMKTEIYQLWWTNWRHKDQLALLNKHGKKLYKILCNIHLFYKISISITSGNMMKGNRQIYLVLAQDKWRAHVNMVINPKFHTMQTVSWLDKIMLISQEGLCSMELVR